MFVQIVSRVLSLQVNLQKNLSVALNVTKSLSSLRIMRGYTKEKSLICAQIVWHYVVCNYKTSYVYPFMIRKPKLLVTLSEAVIFLCSVMCMFGTVDTIYANIRLFSCVYSVMVLWENFVTLSATVISFYSFTSKVELLTQPVQTQDFSCFYPVMDL